MSHSKETKKEPMFNKQEQKVAEELSNSSNIIGKGTILEGNLETFGNIRIEGKVVGNIKTKSKAAFGQSSQVEGSVLAQNAEIAGHISGTVEVTEILVLKPTGLVIWFWFLGFENQIEK